ncbi:hypothetical protein JOM56_015464 [Amanita muscaria]
MVVWSSPLEIVHDARVFERLMHFLLGLYIWEWFISLPFGYQFITGKRTFKWPMTFYFLNRYSLLFALIGIVISLNVETEINCQALYTFNALAGNAAIGMASINLSIRTMAIWGRERHIVGFLVLIILGHWSLLLYGAVLTSVWDPQAGQCVITETKNTVLAAAFICSVCFDFIVMALTAVKTSPTTGLSRLERLIFNDGLIYFVIALTGNLFATTFMLLNPNPIMAVIANVPAATASTIAACSAVRRLNDLLHEPIESFGFSPERSTAIIAAQDSGVHVQMESPNLGEYDEAGNLQDGSYDPEAQNITNELKCLH